VSGVSDSVAELLRASVERALAGTAAPESSQAAESNGIDSRAWRQLKELGLVGSDGADSMGLAEHAVVLEAIGYSAALVPYCESEALARWVALCTDIPTRADEILTYATLDSKRVTSHPIGIWHLDMREVRLPWGRVATRAMIGFVASGEFRIAILPTDGLNLIRAGNLAGEPLDRITVAVEVHPQDIRSAGKDLQPQTIIQRGALCRTAAMLGAARRAEELSLQYAADRKQFGRSISQFQAVQSLIAELAAERAAAASMFATALQAAQLRPMDALPEVAAAKICVNRAARIVAANSHQVHGAIGFTQEYALQLASRRLWAWREEYGSETYWARELGTRMARLRATGFWERMVS
jgi:acyl-CoA dehydrogenase